MAKLSDKGLAGLTLKFKKRLAEGESLEDILPEAFAAICEADKRILGMEPYDVQILGGIALHQGYLAEMNRGRKNIIRYHAVIPKCPDRKKHDSGNG